MMVFRSDQTGAVTAAGRRAHGRSKQAAVPGRIVYVFAKSESSYHKLEKLMSRAAVWDMALPLAHRLWESVQEPERGDTRTTEDYK